MVEVMDLLAQLQENCHDLLRQRQAVLRAARRRRSRLAKRLHKVSEDYATVYQDLSLVDNSCLPDYGDYYQSFELLKVQIELTLRAAGEGEELFEDRPARPSSAKIEDWLDYQDDLTDHLRDLRRWVEQREQKRLVAVLNLVDANERLQRFTLPAIGTRF